jgi:hypothetical protein
MRSLPNHPGGSRASTLSRAAGGTADEDLEAEVHLEAGGHSLVLRPAAHLA